jgi:hypothetical protein
VVRLAATGTVTMVRAATMIALSVVIVVFFAFPLAITGGSVGSDFISIPSVSHLHETTFATTVNNIFPMTGVITRIFTTIRIIFDIGATGVFTSMYCLVVTMQFRIFIVRFTIRFIEICFATNTA